MKLLGMPRRRSAPELGSRELATAWQLLSLLLDYPSAELLERRATLRAVALGLPEPVGRPIVAFLDQLGARPLEEVQMDYVRTFDHERRTCLYLTYFSCGDTRKRGLALVEIKQAYRRAGVIPTESELPDHLCVVLEFGATVDPAPAWRLLNDHRAGVEVARRALADMGSAWAGLLVALCATLPRLRGDEEDAIRRLIEVGPPVEEVGLDGYGIDPVLADARVNPRPSQGALS